MLTSLLVCRTRSPSRAFGEESTPLFSESGSGDKPSGLKLTSNRSSQQKPQFIVVFILWLRLHQGKVQVRQGLGTNLDRLGVPDKVIQGILRHSNVNLTLSYYINPQGQDVLAAMGKFEAEIAAHEFADTDRTPSRTSGAMPESVN